MMRSKERVGASNKDRAMFRAVYAAAAYTTAADADGKTVKSEIFLVRRGVVQGDITSPLYFILALDFLLHTHDKVVGKGVPFGHTLVHTLTYADDAVLVDLGDASDINRATERVSKIALGSKDDADMSINVKKTKSMHVRSQDPITVSAGSRGAL